MQVDSSDRTSDRGYKWVRSSANKAEENLRTPYESTIPCINRGCELRMFRLLWPELAILNPPSPLHASGLKA